MGFGFLGSYFWLAFFCSIKFFDSVSSVQSLSHVRLFATPWIAARQASLSITSSQSSPRLMSIESVMPRFILNILSILYLNVDFEILIQSLNLIFRLIIGRDIKKKIMIISMTLKLQNMHGRNTSSSMNLSLLHFFRVNSNPQYSASPVTKSLEHLRPSCICLSH